jgi:prevent-host-death family protein
MKTMAISKFKTQALKLIAEVAQSQKSIVITKQGKAIAKLVPFTEADNGNKNQPGKLANTLIFEKDIISPLGEDQWEACQ